MTEWARHPVLIEAEVLGLRVDGERFECPTHPETWAFALSNMESWSCAGTRDGHGGGIWSLRREFEKAAPRREREES